MLEDREEASAEDSFLDGDGASCGADDSAQRGDGMSAPADGQEPEETVFHCLSITPCHSA